MYIIIPFASLSSTEIEYCDPLSATTGFDGIATDPENLYCIIYVPNVSHPMYVEDADLLEVVVKVESNCSSSRGM